MLPRSDWLTPAVVNNAFSKKEPIAGYAVALERLHSDCWFVESVRFSDYCNARVVGVRNATQQQIERGGPSIMRRLDAGEVAHGELVMVMLDPTAKGVG